MFKDVFPTAVVIGITILCLSFHETHVNGFYAHADTEESISSQNRPLPYKDV